MDVPHLYNFLIFYQSFFYYLTPGIPELREELTKFHARYDNLSLSSENFVVSPGSKELIYLVMTIFSGGEAGRLWHVTAT